MADEKKTKTLNMKPADPLKVPPFIGETEGQPGESVPLTSTVVQVDNKWAVPIEDYMIVSLAQEMDREVKELGEAESVDTAERMMGSLTTSQTIISAGTVVGLRVLLAHIPQQDSELAKNIKERIQLHRLMLADIVQGKPARCHCDNCDNPDHHS